MVDFSVQAFESKKKPVLVNQSTEMEQEDVEEIKVEEPAKVMQDAQCQVEQDFAVQAELEQPDKQEEKKTKGNKATKSKSKARKAATVKQTKKAKEPVVS